MAQEIESRLAEDALVPVNHQIVVRQHLKGLSEVLGMFLFVARCNQYVIQVDKCIGEVSQDVIHQTLKRLPSVGEAEWHPHKLKQAEWGDHCCLVNVLRRHWNLVITLLKVDLGENGAAI